MTPNYTCKYTHITWTSDVCVNDSNRKPLECLDWIPEETYAGRFEKCVRTVA